MSAYQSLIKLYSATFLSLAILGAGFYLGKGVSHMREPSHFVTVKGLAEKNVKSDLGVWEIDYREIGDNLVTLNQQIQHDQTTVNAFLISHGFENNELSAQPVHVEDRLANVYQQSNTNQTTQQRYIVTSGVQVRSSKVDLIEKINSLTGVLLQQGVALAFDTSRINPNPSYYFTQLDNLRPEMLATATHSARLVAEQFAKDANTTLGSIRHASQGLFEITNRDATSSGWGSQAATSIDKKIRLVTTIDYELGN